MKQQPDKLFHEKLGGYSRPAPDGTWDKIESRLEKRNSKVIWLRVAAALLLLAVSVPVAYTLLDETPTEMAGAKMPFIKKETSAIQAADDSAAHERSVDTEKVTSPSPQREVQTKKVSKHFEEKIAFHEVTPDNTGRPRPDENKNLVTQETVFEVVEVLDTTSEDAVALNESPSQGITLVISSEESTAYFDTEKNLLASDATEKKKKTSTFKKLLRKASDLKTNQDPVGELRQMKNEILALNFKSDKKRSQKNN